MSYNSAERKFYLRHYGGGLTPGATRDMSEIGVRLFHPGQRYHLLLETLKQKQQHLASIGLVAEVGCGNVDGLFYLKNFFNLQNLVGIDIAFDDSIGTIDGITFKTANFNEGLPLNDQEVDVFIAMMVIEHLFDPFHAFGEIKRVLHRDGLAVVNLPLVTSIKNRLRLLAGKLPITSVPFHHWMKDAEWDGNHLHYFSVQTIRQLAEHSGLTVTALAGVGRAHQLKTMMPTLFAAELTFVLKHRP